MKQDKVVILSEYKAKRELGNQLSGMCRLPDPDNLWELLERNISLKVWEKKT